MEPKFENESAKVADKIMNGTSTEAAESLSRSLLPMNHADYNEFLKAVQAKTVPGGGNLLELDLKNNMAHIWSRSDLEPDRVVVMPGQNLTNICKSDLSRSEDPKAITQKEINSCIGDYAKVNKLADPDFIVAGTTLIYPANI